MKPIKHSIARLLFIAILVSSCLAEVNPTLAEDNQSVDKTIFKNDLKQPIQLIGNDLFQIKWQVSGTYPTQMVVDLYGNLYYCDHDNIYAVSSEGNKLWTYKYSYDFKSEFKHLIFGHDGNLYAYEGSSGLFYEPKFPNEKSKKGDLLVLDTKGNKLWSYKFTELTAFWRWWIGAADAKGNFICMTDKGLVSINKEGKLNWSNNENFTLTLQDNFSSTNINWIQVDGSDTVYIGDKNGFLYALDVSTGTMKWKSSAILKKDAILYIGYDGYLYITSDAGVQVLHAKDGSESNKAVTRDVLNSLHIPNDSNGGLYLTNLYVESDGNKKNSIKNIDHSGNVKWIYKTPDSPYGQKVEIKSDYYGNVYFTDYVGNVYSLDHNGNERFRIISSNYISSANYLHVSDKGELYSLNQRYGLIRIGSIMAPISIWIDGEEIIFPLEPRITDGVTMVPMRATFEKLGANVTWNGEDRSISAIMGTTEINLKLDHTVASVNGNEIKLEVAPSIVDGSTLVPLRFVSESFGAQVSWDGDTRSVKITTK